MSAIAPCSCRCPGAAYDEFNLVPGSLPIEVAQGKRRIMKNVTQHTATAQLSLETSLEEIDLQELRRAISALYRVSIDLQVVSGSVLLRVTAVLNDTLLGDFISRTNSMSDGELSNALGVDAQVPRFTIRSETIQVPQDESCPPGYYCSAAESYACPIATWSNRSGQQDSSACLPCPSPGQQTTLQIGTASADGCVCQERYYRTKDGRCLTCPVGSLCANAGLTVASLRVLPGKHVTCGVSACKWRPHIPTLTSESPHSLRIHTHCAHLAHAGYFRPSNTSVDIRRCPDAGENCGGRDVCDESSSGCRGTLNASEPCEPTLTGAYCQLCREAGRHYVAASGDVAAKCEECGARFGAMIIMIGVMSGVMLVTIVVRRIALKYSETLENGTNENLWKRLKEIKEKLKKKLKKKNERYKLHNKVKVLISFYMIATKVRRPLSRGGAQSR